MPWSNGPLIVYHGTDNLCATSIRLQPRGIDSTKFDPKTDFGAGFYVTTVLHQAQQWANEKVRATGANNAEVLEYTLSRDEVESLTHLTFVTDTQDYHDLVAYCWTGAPNHGPSRTVPYDVVYGPVSLAPQSLVIANCDQILFHDPTKLAGFDYPSNSIVPPGMSRFF